MVIPIDAGPMVGAQLRNHIMEVAMRSERMGTWLRIAAVVMAQGSALGAVAAQAQYLCDTGLLPAHTGPVACGDLGFISSDDHSADCTVLNMSQTAAQLSTGEFFFCEALGRGSSSPAPGTYLPLRTNGVELATGCILVRANDNSGTWWADFDQIQMRCALAGLPDPNAPQPRPPGPPGPMPE